VGKLIYVRNICQSKSLDRFRWLSCQLDVLRYCLPSSVRQTLNDLPESLDETYERILKEIKKPNKAHARRVLQCLLVAIRPLHVAELAEVLAVDFDDAEGIPRLKPDWRWEDQEVALQLTCSSLIAIVQAGDSRVVQFSHFSVKEFLTSPRLAVASEEVSNYHIDSKPAHTILAQTCLGVLVQMQVNIDGDAPEDRPLARYAAEHWMTHSRFGGASPRLQKGMEYLFDTDKPHFEAWLTMYDMDTSPPDYSPFYKFALPRKSRATPLYYAALCGLHDLVEHLITENPQDMNADGGYYVRPLVAALAGEHFQTANLLRQNGADLDARGDSGIYPLHAAAYSGNFEVVLILTEYEPAAIYAKDENGSTPLLWASTGYYSEDVSVSVLRLLLEYGADVNVREQEDGWTPLHFASFYGALEVAHLLLEYGADVEAKDKSGRTALKIAAYKRHHEVVELLRKHGAKFETCSFL